MARIFFSAVLLLVLLATPDRAIQGQTGGCPVGKASAHWRFGIAAPYSAVGYDLASLQVGGFLDWQANSHPPLPAGMDYVRVLRVSDAAFSGTLAALPGWVAAAPGAVWLVGNEPDRIYYQDSVTAEVYAERYYQLAHQIIRHLDPTARIGFGTVVQPTPIRIRYLARAYDRLKQLAGGAEAASDLIDIWSVHAFILNESLNDWGAGIPVGFEKDAADAVTITDFADTYSSTIFSQRIQAFRAWLAQMGQRDKPLWVTEYGSLFPPIDPPGIDYVNVSDQDTAAFMVATFDFLLNARDANSGMPADGQRLVQRWFWYSLNEHRYVFGGSLFDPDQGKSLTAVGQTFLQYMAKLPTCFLYLPQVFH